MSLFSKSPKDGAAKPGAPGTKTPAEPAPRTTAPRAPVPPAPPQSSGSRPSPPPPKPPAGPPAVIVTRPVDVGATPRSRPAMPAIAIGPPATPAGPPHAPPPVAAKPAAAPAEPAPPKANDIEVLPPGSVRPKAPSLSDKEGSNVSIADTFERLLSLEDLDEGFASIERPGSSSKIAASPGVALTDLAEVRSLFAQLASNHVRQVRDFMIDLRWRDATVDWIGICEPALRSLRRAADKLELQQLCGALDRFSEELTAAQSGGGRTIDGDRRDALLSRYEELSTLMPQAFALDLDRTQREGFILQSLLLQVPDVKKVTLDKLYAAGLTTLEAMALATPADIAATTGIGEALAARIVARFRAYREQIKAAVPDATRAAERERVAQLTAQLRREHDEYERAAQSWTKEAEEKRKALRKSRSQTLLDIQVVLARLGEVERLKEIERLPFERKVAHLESFLEEARDKYVAQP